MSKVYVFLADGFEEIETAAPAALLRRAGVSVELCSITGQNTLTGSHGIRFLSEQ